MPHIMEVRGEVLVLNGFGMRTVFTSEVYAAGLYLSTPERQWREIVEKKLPMAIRIQVVDAFLGTSERIRSGMEKALVKQAKTLRTGGFQKKMDAFVNPFSATLKEGDVFVISYLPDKGIRVRKNQEERAFIAGYEFKKAVFSIWLGEEPVDKELKKALLKAEVSKRSLALQAEQSALLAGKSAPSQGVEERMGGSSSQEPAAGADPPSRRKKGPSGHKRADRGGALEKNNAPSGREPYRAPGLKKQLESEDIYFPLGGNRLTEEARRKLTEKVKWLKANPGARIVIEGHSDSRGPARLNYRLAEERARKVKAYMARAGIDPARMAVKSYGEDHPAVPGDSSEARSRNRRVHVRLLE